MAKISNPRKVFNFSIEFQNYPINPFLAQKVTIPDSEIEVVEHGDTNHAIKTGGRRSVANVIIEKLLTTTIGDQANKYFWDWHNQVQSFGNGGAVPLAYKRMVLIYEFAEDGVTVLNTWEVYNAWPAKISGQEHDRNSSDNTIESIELACERIEKL